MTARLRSLDLRLRIARARRQAGGCRHGRRPTDSSAPDAGARALDPLIAHLTQLSPLKILERGYAIVTNQAGGIVKQPADAPADSRVESGWRKAKSQPACSDSSEHSDQPEVKRSGTVSHFIGANSRPRHGALQWA